MDVRDVMMANYEFIKDLYLTLAINSGNFPYIPTQVFTRFCKKAKIMDNNITQSRLDQIVSAVKPKAKPLDK